MSDYDTMSLADLEAKQAEMQAQMKELEKAKGEYRGRRLKEMKSQVEDMLAAEGFTLADLGLGRGSQKAPGSAAKLPMKYRNPSNASEMWSGRGRQPQWFKDAEANGTSRADMEI